MEKNIEVSLLLDFYGGLLKPSAREIMTLYYNDDLSLSEIAAEFSITRQGVRDCLKRSEQRLYEYEQKLGMSKRFYRLENGLDEIAARAGELKRLCQGYEAEALAEQIEKTAILLKE